MMSQAGFPHLMEEPSLTTELASTVSMEEGTKVKITPEDNIDSSALEQLAISLVDHLIRQHLKFRAQNVPKKKKKVTYNFNSRNSHQSRDSHSEGAQEMAGYVSFNIDEGEATAELSALFQYYPSLSFPMLSIVA